MHYLKPMYSKRCVFYGEGKDYIKGTLRIEGNVEVLSHNRELKCSQQRINLVVHDELD